MRRKSPGKYYTREMVQIVNIEERKNEQYSFTMTIADNRDRLYTYRIVTPSRFDIPYRHNRIGDMIPVEFAHKATMLHGVLKEPRFKGGAFRW